MAENEDQKLAEPKAGGGDNLIERLYFGTAEKTLQESALVPTSINKPYNQDDLVQKDTSYGIYEDMLKDDQVSVALKLKKDLVLNSGWEIVTEDEDQEEIADDLDKSLREDTECPLDDQLEEILSAYEFGFSITEKIFQKRPDGSLTFKRLKTRHPATWTIYTDEKGNVEKYAQTSRQVEIDVDPMSIIHYVNNPRFQNPYGESDLRAAFNAWFTKRQITKFYAIFLEKAASPIPVARYDKNAPASAVTKIFDVLKRFQQKTAIVIPKDIEVDFLEHGKQGEAYIKGINLFNMFIGRALFVPDLLGMSGGETGGGSFALGKEHLNIYIRHVQKRRNIIEQIVNEHIIKPLVTYNYGFMETFPKFKFKPISDEDALEATKLWLEGTKANLYKPTDEEINYFRKKVKFPEGDVERVEPPPPPPPPIVAAPPPPAGDGEAPPPGDDTGPFGLDPSDMEKMQSFAQSPYKVPKGDYYKKVDFKMIERNMDNSNDMIMAEADPVIKFMFEDLFDQISKKRILQTGNVDKIDSLKIRKLKNLNIILRSNLKNQFLDGKKIAQKELFKSNFIKTIVDESFLKILDAEVFQFIAKYEFAIKEKAKVELIAAIKDGRPLSTVVDVLDNEGKQLSEVQLARFSRTKGTEVLNKGRVSFFEDSDIVSGYQYSAILDDRTTAICNGLHGKVFKQGSEPIPPMHFNCRSILVPITKFEEFKPDEEIKGQPVDTFIKDNAGKGFGKR